MNNQTIISYVAPKNADDNAYSAAHIKFSSEFDIDSLPKSVRASRSMKIDCTPKGDNKKNETGIKRLCRVLKALEGTPVKVEMTYGNSVTKEEFFDLIT